MAHETTENDGAVFANKPWHNIGKLIQDMDLDEAMQASGLNWLALKTPVYSGYGESYDYVDGYSAIMREDTRTVLSIQSSKYEIVQNKEVFELAASMSDRVKVESAFSMGGGKKLVLLLKGDSFDAGKNDQVDKYFAFINSFDGSLPLGGMPTSIRVCCANTLRMALTESRNRMFKITHKGNMESKLEEMRKALDRYKTIGDLFESKVKTLSSKDMTKDEIQKFWLDVWATIEEPVVSNPSTAKQEENYKKATAALYDWSNIFDEERSKNGYGANLWVAANAATNWIQHAKVGTRGRKASEDSRTFNNILGTSQDSTVAVIERALEYV